ncbi:hypothetical protein EON62_03690 [archaeon]|nr:MAG: hypothetical protein EON62_03690 [archaeon]
MSPHRRAASRCAAPSAVQMTQGLWESDNSLRQVFSADDVALLYSKATKMTRKPTNLQQFLELPASERPILATMAEADREDAEALCADMPLLKVCPRART